MSPIRSLCTIHTTDGEEIWPTEVARHLDSGRHAMADGTSSIATRWRNIRITSPLDGEHLAMTDQARVLPLRAESNAARDLFWFVNGKYIGKCRPGVALEWPMQVGTVEISCSNESGQTQTSRITVEDLTR